MPSYSLLGRRWDQGVQDIKKVLGVWDPPSGLSIHSP